MTTQLSRRTVRNGDLELAVFEAGDRAAPTVLLVHGWPDTHQLWHAVTDHLASDFHVVSYDTRGMGESDDPGTVEGFRLPELASDLFVVADAVSPDAPVHLLGHDWGSLQAWEAVCDPRADERIASFTSISGPNVDHLGQWVRNQLASGSPRGIFDVLRQAASSSYVAFFVSPLAPPAFRKVASKERWDQFLRKAEGIEPDPENHAPTLVDDMVSGLRYYRANVLGGLGGPRERRTDVPVLQLVMEKDPAIRPANLDESARWASRLEQRELPYGHWVPLSHPEVVAEETARFIRAHT